MRERGQADAGLGDRECAGAERASLKEEVSSLVDDAGEENWDGEGALALAPETVDIARRMIDGFPVDTGRPDVSATPHGEVDFDWIIDRNRMLTLSVGPSGSIAFSGLFGDARVNGREPWKGRLPQRVHCCLQRLRKARNE